MVFNLCDAYIEIFVSQKFYSRIHESEIKNQNLNIWIIQRTYFICNKMVN
ncbi:hypothetical protein EUTSA_v10005487mg [Eutrema salsugineum]|uniref:Uncharacterized protein n=1 Tax=Eutrema salsugineum TaxID=72664 RepID=V4KT30_EUTSA|nr:hypothetical protein EUTSA_v10005487mg [Eutrema salsugineum]